MSLRMRLQGDKQMIRTLENVAKRMNPEAARALRQEAEVEARESKKRTPVDTSALKNSIHVEGPFSKGLIRPTLSADIVAGGSAAPYALIVHEDLEAHHDVGQAKYIESVLNESAPHMGRRIAARMDLNKVVR